MSEMLERIAAVRERLSERGLDGILITHPDNRRYLTGFTAGDIPPNESAGMLLLTNTDAFLITGSVNVTQAESQAPHVAVQKREKSWAEDAANLIQELDLHRLGYEAHAIVEGVFRSMNEQLVEAGHNVEWVASDGLVDELRAVKSPSEIALLKRAFEITCDAFNAVAGRIEAGQTEREIAWQIHSEMVARGAEGPAFPIIVASGTNAARPHHEPDDTVIQAGVPIIIDVGALFEGYCADLTRTVWVGEPDEQLQDVYPVVASAVEQVFERLHPGVNASDMDAVARNSIDQNGYGEAFTHGLGHGVGLRVHEAPSARSTSEDTLVPGNVITIEPGVYLPDWGGVRVEDVVLITEDGFEVLTSAAVKNAL